MEYKTIKGASVDRFLTKYAYVMENLVHFQNCCDAEKRMQYCLETLVKKRKKLPFLLIHNKRIWFIRNLKETLCLDDIETYLPCSGNSTNAQYNMKECHHIFNEKRYTYTTRILDKFYRSTAILPLNWEPNLDG